MLASPHAPRRGALLTSMIALIAGARSLLRRKLQKPEDQAPRLGARDDPGETRQTEKPTVDFVSNDACVSHAPTPQATIDILDGWVSILPAALGADTRGSAPLFADERAIWAIDRLGGVRGATILELGPLEGGHTYMLDRAGAKSIIAIEGNKRCYLKCLITKELLGVDSAHPLLGDFVAWLEQDRRRFDVIWATGVLYHMTEPLRLLRLLADRTDRLHLWTHFYPDDYLPKPLPKPLTSIEDREFEGEKIRHYLRSYMGAESTTAYCGGVYSGSAWLCRSDILKALEKFGLSKIEIAFERPFAGDGPSFALVASRG